MNIKDLLWRCIYAAVLLVVLAVVLPLIIAAAGVSLPNGPAIDLIRVAFALLIVVYVLFGPTPPSPF
jgi:hypothetical protein